MDENHWRTDLQLRRSLNRKVNEELNLSPTRKTKDFIPYPVGTPQTDEKTHPLRKDSTTDHSQMAIKQRMSIVSLSVSPPKKDY